MIDAQSNSITRHLHDGQRLIVKRYVEKPWTVKKFKYRLLGKVGGETPIEYQSPESRRDFESDSLRLWRDHGFRVPQQLDIPPELMSEKVALAEEEITGETLNDRLRDQSISIRDKLSDIESVLVEMRERHSIALYTQEFRLIHFDSNMRNILITPEGPSRIDFEMGRTSEKFDRSVAREVHKLVLEMANALGREHFGELIDLLFTHYRIRHILRRVADDILKVTWGRYHRGRDQKKKLRHHGLVTKFDLADAIQSRFKPKRDVDAKKSKQLVSAEHLSWDGKFYQSLDDSDPRGRDMQHRYQVMGFPESFAGKSVLDIGCNLGRICIDAASRGAARAVGVDFRDDVMRAINHHCKSNHIEAEFYTADIDDGVNALQTKIGKAPFDMVFALSIWSHVNKPKFWEILNLVCGHVLYFEDNSPSRVQSLEVMEATLKDNLDFSKIDFLGFTTDRGVRAVYRLER